MKKITLLSLLLALCLAALTACSAGESGQTPAQSGAPSSSAPAESSAQPEQPSSEPGQTTPEVESSETVESAPVAETAAPSEPQSSQGTYTFGQPVPENSTDVDESWFEDAVFLGDSRTEGLQLYSGLHAGDFFWHKGMTVFRVDDEDYRQIEVDGKSMTMMEALARKQYAKVYIMIGVNELGYPASSYAKGLKAMVDRVKEIQPNAVIYLQTLPPVNEQVAADSGLGSYINNTNVNTFNDIIVETAREKQVALLDVASVFRDDQGALPADMASDGVHFRREGYQLWYAYLRCHVLTADEYANAQAPEEGA